MSLYQKYRPKSFKAIIGNSEVVTSLLSLLENKETCPHAFLLSGVSGTGKTTLARIIAKQLGAIKQEVIEVDSGQFRGIDTIRDIRNQSQYPPLSGSPRVWILDECHQLSKDAQSAMLKILEDTPNHIYFILCTTEPQKLLPTIRGRCSQHVTKTLTENQMFSLLRGIVKREKQTLDKEIYEQIIDDSFGQPRDAINILEKVLSVEENERLITAKQAAEQQSQSIELCRALIGGAGWKEISLILKGLKEEDPESIRRHVLGYCQSVILKSTNDRAAAIIEEFYEPLYNIGFPGLVFNCYSIVNQ